MTSPTSSTPRVMPSAARFSTAVSDGQKQEPREAVGDDPVDLLGHAHVEGAQAGLDVRQRHAELGRDEGSGERRVGVAVDEHRVGPLLAATARSMPISMAAVCSACEPEPTSSRTSGSPSPSSSLKTRVSSWS